MLRSRERILTTHVGSLPRTERMLELLRMREAGEEVDQATFDEAVEQATESVVRKQDEAGIDIASDGEQARLAFLLYVTQRLEGFGGEVPAIQWSDLEEFPDYAEQVPHFCKWSEPDRTRPAVTEPLTYRGEEATRKELELFDRITEETGADFEQRFITAASPGTIASYLGNEYYDSHEEYVHAVADALKTEYELIGESDAILQIDSPDLAGGRHLKFKDASTDDFVGVVQTHIEALNKALENVPTEETRMHVCWGNYEGPHHHDVPLEAILPEIYKADISGLQIEQANPTHHHQHELFEEYPLPEDWVLIPGLIDVCVNYIEPPEVIADRIETFAEHVGDPTRIIAGADCGLGTFAGMGAVEPAIAWKKLESLSKGAELATERLFDRQQTATA